MITVVISILLALLVVTVPSWWSTRERVHSRPARERLLTTVARLWLGTRRRPDTALRRLARPVISAALRQARKVDGDVRLTLPRRLVIHAHRDDVALLVQHAEEFVDEMAAVLRRDLGFLVVPGRPTLCIDVDPTALPNRPEVMRAGPAPPEQPTSTPAATVVREHRVRHLTEPADTLVIPTSDRTTTPSVEDHARQTCPLCPAMEGRTVAVQRR